MLVPMTHDEDLYAPIPLGPLAPDELERLEEAEREIERLFAGDLESINYQIVKQSIATMKAEVLRRKRLECAARDLLADLKRLVDEAGQVWDAFQKARGEQ